MNLRNLAALFGALLLATALNGCGGGKSFKNGNVRLVNLTDAALDLRVGGVALAAGVAAGAASGYVQQEEGSTSFELALPGNTNASLTLDAEIDNDKSYSVIAYTTDKERAAALVSDDVGEPASGKVGFRLFNASREAGNLDVYVTTANASLSSATPVNANVAAQTVSGYVQQNAGTYRIRVTAAGDNADLRLDIPSITLAEKQLVTLVVQASESGVLLNGTRLDQQGAPVAHPNGSVRLSVVADLASGGQVGVKIGVDPIVTALTSPGVTPYQTIAIADLPALTVGGVAPALDEATPGSDLTLLVRGDGRSPTLTRDDNRRSGSPSRSRLRLWHGINGYNAPLSIDQSSLVLTTPTAAGTFSPAFDITAGTGVSLRALPATNGDCSSAPWQLNGATLVAGGVYTVFALGLCEGAGKGVLVLRQDR